MPDVMHVTNLSGPIDKRCVACRSNRTYQPVELKGHGSYTFIQGLVATMPYWLFLYDLQEAQEISTGIDPQKSPVGCCINKKIDILTEEKVAP